MSNRETVKCPVCGVEIGKPCDFNGKPAPEVNDNGVMRRVVHAGRYAQTLPENERSEFWESAIEKYLSTELGLMNP